MLAIKAFGGIEDMRAGDPLSSGRGTMVTALSMQIPRLSRRKDLPAGLRKAAETAAAAVTAADLMAARRDPAATRFERPAIEAAAALHRPLEAWAEGRGRDREAVARQVCAFAAGIAGRADFCA